MKPSERDALEAIIDHGPIDHDELAERLELHWHEVTPIIQSLRTEGEVRLTLNRRYEAVETDARSTTGSDHDGY